MSSPNSLELGELANRPARKRWTDALLERVQTKRGWWLVVSIALVLALPSLRFGLQTDDHVASSVASTNSPSPLRSFGFEPRPGYDRSSGYLAWWSSPQLRVQFLRPLSAVSHVDIYLGAHAAWFMHANNVLLYLALVFVAFQLYRELMPTLPRTAALASILFAIDDGHAPAIGWISSRNTLLYSLFALSALLWHQRARARERAGSSARGARLASAMLTALALLSGEGGIAILAFLIAYELSFETGGLRSRIARVWPQLAMVALWLIAYVAGNYGVRGTSFYRELSDPAGTLLAGLADLPVWLLGLVGPSAIGLAIVAPAVSARLIAAALVLALLAAGTVLPRTPLNRFFALSTLLCLFPLFTTVPQDRVLIPASFAAFGLFSDFISSAARSAYRYVRGVRWGMIAVHCVLAPVLFIPMLGQAAAIEAGSQAIVAAIPERSPAQVILVNTPVELLTLYALTILRQQPGRTAPEQLLQLYAGSSALDVTRIDSNTLELHTERGWGASTFERIFGRLENMPRVGEPLQLDRLEVSVQESDAAGHPTRVRFRFASSLDAPDLLFYMWDGRAPVPWQPPAIGQHTVLAPLSVLGSLPR